MYFGFATCTSRGMRRHRQSPYDDVKEAVTSALGPAMREHLLDPVSIILRVPDGHGQSCQRCGRRHLASAAMVCTDCQSPLRPFAAPGTPYTIRGGDVPHRSCHGRPCAVVRAVLLLETHNHGIAGWRCAHRMDVLIVSGHVDASGMGQVSYEEIKVGRAAAQTWPRRCASPRPAWSRCSSRGCAPSCG